MNSHSIHVLMDLYQSSGTLEVHYHRINLRLILTADPLSLCPAPAQYELRAMSLYPASNGSMSLRQHIQYQPDPCFTEYMLGFKLIIIILMKT